MTYLKRGRMCSAFYNNLIYSEVFHSCAPRGKFVKDSKQLGKVFASKGVRIEVRVQIKSGISYDFDLGKKIVCIFVSD